MPGAAQPAVARAPAAAAAGQQPGRQNEGGGGGGGITSVMKTVAMFFVIQNVMQFVLARMGYNIGGANNGSSVNKTADASASPNASPVNSTQHQPKEPQLNLVPLFETGTLLDISVRLSESRDPFTPLVRRNEHPSVTWQSIPLAKESRVWETQWTVPHIVKHNASFYAHIYVSPAGTDTTAALQGGGDVMHLVKPLTRYMPQRRIRATKKLIAGSSTKEEEKDGDTKDEEDDKKELPIISYYHPNLTLAIVDSKGPVAYSTLPPALRNYVQIARPGQNDEKGNGYHHPIVWTNDFWLLKEQMNPINETSTVLPLRVTLDPTSFFKFQIMESLHDSMQEQAKQGGPGQGGELDMIKRTLLEANPYMLGLTLLVSILHMLFEFLAFTSDVQHWRSKKDMVGVSVRTILTNVFTQLVILLYLIDSSEETSYMILFSQGMGLVIEAWKITKAVDVKVIPTPGSVIPYRVEFHDKHVLTEDEKKTQEYDKLAFKWVAWGMTPLILGYTIYSLLYNEHRGWYSFTIATLTSFVYSFSFVTLVPQLIINYKLKSVAHISMKAFAYKFFGTIVDDLGAFVIRMPLLYRIAVFRDDVVFVILLYQYWIYKVDYTRENEYGQKLSGEQAAKLAQEQAEKAREQAKAAKNAVAPSGEESRKDR